VLFGIDVLLDMYVEANSGNCRSRI